MQRAAARVARLGGKPGPIWQPWTRGPNLATLESVFKLPRSRGGQRRHIDRKARRRVSVGAVNITPLEMKHSLGIFPTPSKPYSAQITVYIQTV